MASEENIYCGKNNATGLGKAGEGFHSLSGAHDPVFIHSL